MSLKALAYSAVTIILLSFLDSCGKNDYPVYSEFATINESGIPQNAIISFSPEESDTTLSFNGLYDAVIVVRYTKKVTSDTIFLNLEEFSAKTQVPDSSQLNIPLFDDKGNPRGRGTYGVFEIRDTIHHAIPIPEGYSALFSSPVETAYTKGIKSIGFLIYLH